jgi:hypothetical protein
MKTTFLKSYVEQNHRSSGQEIGQQTNNSFSRLNVITSAHFHITRPKEYRNIY